MLGAAEDGNMPCRAAKATSSDRVDSPSLAIIRAVRFDRS